MQVCPVLLQHPAASVRSSAVEFVAAAARSLSQAESYALLLPPVEAATDGAGAAAWSCLQKPEALAPLLKEKTQGGDLYSIWALALMELYLGTHLAVLCGFIAGGNDRSPQGKGRIQAPCGTCTCISSPWIAIRSSMVHSKQACCFEFKHWCNVFHY